MDNLAKNYKRLQGIMMFMGALGQGSEKIMGRGAKVVGFQAGKTIGLDATKNLSSTTDNLEEAIDIVQKAIYDMGVDWKFGLWKDKDAAGYVTDEGDKLTCHLYFQDCLIRNTLYTYAHKQQGSLCLMESGFLCGALERVMGGRKTGIEIIHAGENACFKKVTVNKGKGGEQ